MVFDMHLSSLHNANVRTLKEDDVHPHYIEAGPEGGKIQTHFEELIAQDQNTNAYEADFMRQRAKITWLKFNDANNSYFHASLKARRPQNVEREIISRCLFFSDEMKGIPVIPISRQEVQEAFSSFDTNSSPDVGYMVLFFKKAWNVTS
ncbi:hypothetical protein Ancab_004613 [Ancistrocladus abbreviatus]